MVREIILYVRKFTWFFAGASVAVAFSASIVTSWVRLPLIGIAALAAAYPVFLKNVLEEREQKAEELAAKLRSDMKIALGDVVVPLAELLGEMANIRSESSSGSPTEREQLADLRGRMVGGVIGAAAENLGGGRARGSFWKIEPGTGDLVLYQFAGRGDQPRKRWVDGADEPSTAIHALVRERAVDFENDLPSDKAYRSWASVSVFVADKEYGVLNVDSPGPRDIDEPQVAYLSALAQLLAVGLAICDRDAA